MTFTDTPAAELSMISPQALHREAAVQLEIAAKHHRLAALLHDVGAPLHAGAQANLAHMDAEKALAESDRAVKVTLWLAPEEADPSPESLAHEVS